MKNRTTGQEPASNRVSIDPRIRITSGKQLYKITKPGFRNDLFLTQEQMNQFIAEAQRLGLIGQ